MFDDHVPQNNGQVPPNLPFGEPPQDMFSAVPEPDTEQEGDTTPVSPPAAPAPDTALARGMLTPKQEPTLPESPVAPALADASANEPPMPELPVGTYDMREPKMSRGLFVMAIVLGGIFLVGLGLFAAYQFFVPGETAPPAAIPTNTDTNTAPDAVVPDVVEPTAPGLSDKDIDNSLIFGEPIDQDGDGLDDVREGGIGTDPKNWDSDTDGLSDGDEVIIWKTEPLNPDSDGDGYTDGMEVKSGYSPTGSGRLFEPPVETK